VTEFCTAKTHNTEAPNLQNKMCNHKSTWDVIKESDDFQNASPMTGTNLPPHPTFSLLKSKHRVVCLVLDKSGSMNTVDHLVSTRLLRMNQAAELYLIQIIEKGSMVGMVTFDSTAEIQNKLTKVINDNTYLKLTANLPKIASGGTSICNGLKAGFQAITYSNLSTFGAEIILLTDGEDDAISSCFEDIKQSGVIIHTIALGPSAAKELETLSNMTGGLRFYANKDINGLIDAFSRISSRSGNISQQALQAITYSNLSTFGAEIILLTDGEDDAISSCFEDIKQSGVIIHTIALGPSAAKELETLSNMTGGLRFYANKDINGLIDAFSRISSRSGNISQQALQLESKALNITRREWINGTVPVDSTIGNDTFFVVTWTIRKPEIILQDPKGKIYKTSDFKDDKLNIHSARLRIPDIAETGTWTYSLLNNHPNSQLLTVTMTTRARSPATLPIIATAHMNQNTAHYPSPMIVYARVSQGFLPVLGVNVTAIIETQDGQQVTLELWDNGIGADTVKNDGIYSRYFTDYHGNGRYSLKVHVQARKNTARLSLRQQPNKALYIPGYVENAKSYNVRISKCFLDLQKDFDIAASVNTSALIPKEAGSKEIFEFKPEHFKIENGTKFYIAIQAINEDNLISEVSNIVQATKFIPPKETSIPALGTNISAISLTVLGLAAILSVF
ncbi:Hypothetical predicted protein, partial [Marmota monax]